MTPPPLVIRLCSCMVLHQWPWTPFVKFSIFWTVANSGFAIWCVFYWVTRKGLSDLESYTPEQGALITEYRNRVLWRRRFLHDYWIHVKNKHPLLSLFQASDFHPYPRKYRVPGFIMSLVAALLYSPLFSRLPGSPWEQIATKLIWVTIPMVMAQKIFYYVSVWRTMALVETRGRASFLYTVLLVYFAYGYIGASPATYILLSECEEWEVGAHYEVFSMEAFFEFTFTLVQFWVVWFVEDIFIPCIGFGPCSRKHKPGFLPDWLFRYWSQEAADEANPAPLNDIMKDRKFCGDTGSSFAGASTPMLGGRSSP